MNGIMETTMSTTMWAALAQDAYGYILNARPDLSSDESPLVGERTTLADARSRMREMGLATSGSAKTLWTRLLAACAAKRVCPYQGLPIGHKDGCWDSARYAVHQEVCT